MSNTPKYWNAAKKYLSKKDKVMASLINKYKSPSETILSSRKDVFFSLCKSIIGQQISVAAANSVFLRFKKKCKNKINAKIRQTITSPFYFGPILKAKRGQVLCMALDCLQNGTKIKTGGSIDAAFLICSIMR